MLLPGDHPVDYAHRLGPLRLVCQRFRRASDRIDDRPRCSFAARGTAARSSRSSAATSSATTSRAAIMTSMLRCRFFCPPRLPADRHARRLHPHPGTHSEQANAVRHRHRRTDCRVHGRGPGAVSGHVDVEGCRVSQWNSTAWNWASRCSSRSATWLIWGPIPDGYTVNLHPVAFGAWFGLLATALNLFPIGQFDGGHISYAVLGRKSSQVTLVMIGCAAVLTYFSTELARLDCACDRDVVRVRPAPSSDVRRRRAARCLTAVARDFRGRHVHSLLHARAHRTPQTLAVTLSIQDVRAR